ncbi:hypothetical protein AAG570_001728 [Ranatra chinensis]|uniref:RING-type domain-containing protein n=1 Tax=Ranatra chinensis TaxID=642074 RepID=A0ABD0YRY2_9HEMI
MRRLRTPSPVRPCPVCLRDMDPPGAVSAPELMATPCGHVFCSSCLSTSLQFAAQCPLCRCPILDPHTPEEEDDSEQPKSDNEDPTVYLDASDAQALGSSLAQ